MTNVMMLKLTVGVFLLSLVFCSKCPDQQRCGDEQMCCQIRSGEFNCCPFNQGECCEDHLHCCPEGMFCEVNKSRCTNATHSLSWAARFPPEHTEIAKEVRSLVTGVPCDDKVSCPDGTTCCKNKQEGWSCCPLPQAVCCEDFIHCCPHGTTCNIPAESCDNSTSSVPWIKKEPSRSVGGPETKGTSVSDVLCDNTTACPDGTTCCKNDKGGWSCCPLPQAVCCEDFIHCCPHGTTCDLAAGSCEISSSSVPWRKKEPSLMVRDGRVPEASVWGTAVQQDRTDIDCGGGFSCKDSETCCRTSESSWGCCPYAKAVCCSDMLHCCPNGYTCDKSGSCTRALGFDWEKFSRKKQAGAV